MRPIAAGPSASRMASAWSTSRLASGGVRSLVVNGPPLYRFDIGASKRFRIHGPVTFEFRAEMLNAFNVPYFNPASTATTSVLTLTAAATVATGTYTVTVTIPGTTTNAYYSMSMSGTAKVLNLDLQY